MVVVELSDLADGTMCHSGTSTPTDPLTVNIGTSAFCFILSIALGRTPVASLVFVDPEILLCERSAPFLLISQLAGGPSCAFIRTEIDPDEARITA